MRILFAILLLLVVGCKSFNENVRHKTIVAGGKIYGIRITAASMTLTPDIIFGCGEINYISIPGGLSKVDISIESEERGWFKSTTTSKRKITIKESD